MAEHHAVSFPEHMFTLVKLTVVSGRPKQWTKNLTIFSALLFSINVTWSPDDLSGAIIVFARSVSAFVLFSLLASAVYIINDVADKKQDLSHPYKRYRPISSGQLSVGIALTAAGIMSISSLGLSFMLSLPFGGIMSAYLALMILYSLGLKNVGLVDIFVISAGFLLRIVAGAIVVSAEISPWLYICGGLGALLIALGKRRTEMVLAGTSGEVQRNSLNWYTVEIVDQFVAIIASSVLISYAIYAFTSPFLPDNHAMMLTIPFVTYGLMRYIYLVYEKNMGERPEEIILSDIPLIVAGMLWVSTAIGVLMLYR